MLSACLYVSSSKFAHCWCLCDIVATDRPFCCALQALHSGPKGTVVAVLCGHDHKGQYHRDSHGIHHITFMSPLNLGASGHAYGLMEVYPDALVLRGPQLADLLPTKTDTNLPRVRYQPSLPRRSKPPAGYSGNAAASCESVGKDEAAAPLPSMTAAVVANTAATGSPEQTMRFSFATRDPPPPPPVRRSGGLRSNIDHQPAVLRHKEHHQRGHVFEPMCESPRVHARADWYCDVCKANTPRGDRYRCMAKGCDFDVCSSCWAHGGSSMTSRGEQTSREPR